MLVIFAECNAIITLKSHLRFLVYFLDKHHRVEGFLFHLVDYNLAGVKADNSLRQRHNYNYDRYHKGG